MPRPSSSFHTAPHTRARGSAAEDAACAWLARRGYLVLHRNYRARPGEIDVIATEGDTLCFLEIKARAGRRYGPGAAAVTPAKRRRIARVAACYLATSGWDGPCRFDVLGLETGPDGTWRFQLIRDAFRQEP